MCKAKHATPIEKDSHYETQAQAGNVKPTGLPEIVFDNEVNGGVVRNQVRGVPARCLSLNSAERRIAGRLYPPDVTMPVGDNVLTRLGSGRFTTDVFSPVRPAGARMRDLRDFD